MMVKKIGPGARPPARQINPYKEIVDQTMKSINSFVEENLKMLVEGGISIDRISVGEMEGNPLYRGILIDEQIFCEFNFNKIIFDGDNNWRE